MEYLLTPEDAFLNKSRSSDAGLDRTSTENYDNIKISSSQTSFLPVLRNSASEYTDQSSIGSRIRVSNESGGLYLNNDLDRSSYMVDSSAAEEERIEYNDKNKELPFPDYPEKVFFLLTQNHHPRDWCLKFISWPWFEQLSIAVIIVNCITLGMYKPCEDIECSNIRCKILSGFDHFIFGFFAVELLIKLCAMGLIGQSGYFSDPWNRLDMVIVIAGLIEYIPSTGDMSLTAIRTVRVLRPLRAINRIPSMRILVMLLLDTLPMLGNVLLLCFFVFFIFGIVGVQMWQGILRNRCYLHLNSSYRHPGLNLSYYYQINQSNTQLGPHKDFICSPDNFNGLIKCSDIPPSVMWLPSGEARVCNDSALPNSDNMPTNVSCVNWNQYYSKCEARASNPYFGAINFDNIGFAWVAIFQVISMESWVDIMYYVQDAHSFWDWSYFVSLIIIGSFFMINLCLVVIATQFSETKKRETERMLMERKKQQSTSTLGSSIEPQSCYHEIIKMISRFCRHLLKTIVKRYEAFSEKHENLSYITKRLVFIHNKNTIKKNKMRKKQKNDKSSKHLVKDFKYKDIDRTKFKDSFQVDFPTQPFNNLNQALPCKVLLNVSNRNLRPSDSQIPPAYLKLSMIRGLNGSSRSQSLSSDSMLSASPMLIKVPSSQLKFITTADISTSRSNQSFVLRRSSWNSNYRRSQAMLIKENVNDQSKELLSSNQQISLPQFQRPVTGSKAKVLQFKNLNDAINHDKVDESIENSDYESDGDQTEIKKSIAVRFRKKMKSIVAHRYFQRGILIAILINTLSMGIEYHNQPVLLTNTLEYSNMIFNGLFLVEMLLKILAEGLLGYISNGFNVFDGGIVILGLVELAQEGGASGLSVLRTFRLLRILKLVRFMPALRLQLIVMLKTMDNVATFFALLILFIFIFSILGMSLFGCKFCKFKNGKKKCDRKNFDSLLWAIVTVFQILTQEDWNAVLISGMSQTSSWAALYFVALMTFGNYVLFNLLVAILVEGFSTERVDEAKLAEKMHMEKHNEEKMAVHLKHESSKQQEIIRKANLENQDVIPNNKNIAIIRKGSLNQKQVMPIITHTDATPMPSPRASPFNDREIFHQEMDSLSRKSQMSSNIDGDSLNIPLIFQSDQRNFIRRGSDSSISRQSIEQQYRKINESQTRLHPSSAIQSIHTDGLSLIQNESNNSPIPNSRSRSPSLQLYGVPITLNKFNSNSGQITQHSGVLVRRSSVGQNSNCSVLSNQNTAGSLTLSEKADETYSKCPSPSTEPNNKDTDAESSLICNSRRSSSNSSRFVSPESFHNSQPSLKTSMFLPMVFIDSSYVTKLPSNITMTNEKCPDEESSLLNQDDDQNETEEKLHCNYSWCSWLSSYIRTHYYDSFFILSPDNRFRNSCQNLLERKLFDNIVLFFIALNCITLAMERPSIPQKSKEKEFLIITNYIFTVIFTIEMTIKVIAKGFVIGKHSYLRSGWNVMDGLLVFISLADIIIVLIIGHSSRIFGILRVFRLLRTLRPLRVISRAPGLKLVVQTLLSSLRPIGNIVLICCTFFIIFGIFGVQLFKGKFFYCSGPDISNVKNYTDCIKDKRNSWKNQQYNFDNLGQALMSLFVLASKDGWVQIMYTGLDAVGVDQQPQENYNEWCLLYFISFLLLVGFFVLNMFVGVVVENFHKCRENQEKEEKARRAAKRARRLEKKKKKMMQPPYWKYYPHWRLLLHGLVNSKYFDLAIAGIIGLNVITMAMEFYMMPHELEIALKSLNYIFTSVFIIEAFIKTSAYGPKRYIIDRWNQLDVLIVILSVSGIIMEEMKNKYIPINMTIIRVFRVLRIARVLKLLKMAKGIRALLDTVIQALPQVGNLGLLFFLLFFIFAALGVELFGRLECSDYNPCTGLSRHAHFENFGMAFLTLFRIATGDNWNGIMKDTLRIKCNKSEECQKDCCVSPIIAPIYFVIFVLMAQFVLVNVVVAVLMKHLEESHKMMCDDDEIEKEVQREIDEENKEKQREKNSSDSEENDSSTIKEIKEQKIVELTNNSNTVTSNNNNNNSNIVESKKIEIKLNRLSNSAAVKFNRNANSQDSVDSEKTQPENGSGGTLHILNLPASRKLHEQLSQSQPLLLVNLNPDSLKNLNQISNTNTQTKPVETGNKKVLLKNTSKKWSTMDDGFPVKRTKLVYHLATDIPLSSAVIPINAYPQKTKKYSEWNEDDCDEEIQKITGVKDNKISNAENNRRKFVMQKSYSMQQNSSGNYITIKPIISKTDNSPKKFTQKDRANSDEQHLPTKPTVQQITEISAMSSNVPSIQPNVADNRRKMFAAGGGKKRSNSGALDPQITTKDECQPLSSDYETCPITNSSNLNMYLKPSSTVSSVMAGSISRKRSNVVMSNLEVPNPHVKGGSVSPISVRSNNIPKVTPEASEEYIDQDSDF